MFLDNGYLFSFPLLELEVLYGNGGLGRMGVNFFNALKTS